MKNFLRFAISMSNGAANNFYSNLCKIIKVELADSSSTGLSIDEIKQRLFSNYELEFSESEIKEAILREKRKEIITLDDQKCIYSINPTKYEKFQKKEESKFDKIINDFLKQYPQYCNIAVETIKILINRYIYYAFDEDKKTFLSFMNYKKKMETDLNEHFNQSEKKLLNDLLLWDNNEKNEFISNCVSCCYDYCMLTIKRDNSSNKDVFNNKAFYLDTNIIFKYALFQNNSNNSEIKYFIEKCEQAKIDLKYTNVTNAEINATIIKKIKEIKDILGPTQAVNIPYIKLLYPQKSLDFYNAYFEWKKINKDGSFEEFKTYLDLKIQRVLKKLKYESFENQDSPNNNRFASLQTDLTIHKARNEKYSSDSAIKHDVNMYLFISKKNKESRTDSFVEVKNYFITLDKCFVQWTIDKNPGTIPTFTLPSVWYSTLLKYKGRTENDYRTFCSFLRMNLDYEINETDSIPSEKVLKKILEINENDDFKNELIYRIDNDLKTIDIGEFTDDELDTYIKDKQESLTNEKVDEAVSYERKTSEENIKKAREEEKNKAREDLKIALEEEKNKSAKKVVEHGKIKFVEGINEGVNKIAAADAKRIYAKRCKIKKHFAIGLIIFLTITIIAGIAILIIRPKIFGFINENSGIISIILFCLDIISIIITSFLSKHYFISEEEIFKKRLNEYKNKIK